MARKIALRIVAPGLKGNKSALHVINLAEGNEAKGYGNLFATRSCHPERVDRKTGRK